MAANLINNFEVPECSSILSRMKDMIRLMMRSRDHKVLFEYLVADDELMDYLNNCRGTYINSYTLSNLNIKIIVKATESYSKLISIGEEVDEGYDLIDIIADHWRYWVVLEGTGEEG